MRTFYGFLLQRRPTSALFFVLITLAPVVSSIQPYFLKLFVDAIPQLNYNKLLQILFILAGVRLLGIALGTLAYHIGDIILLDAAIKARNTIFKHIHDLDFAFHTQKSSGSLISAIKRGDGALWNLYHGVHFRIVDVSIRFLVMLVFFKALNTTIFLYVVASFVLALVITKFFIKWNISTRQRVNDEEDSISAVIVDNMINFETVKLFAKEVWEQKKLNEKQQSWRRAVWQHALSFRGLDVSMGIITTLSIILILITSLRATINGQFSIGDFVLVVGFLQSFYPQLFELVWGFRDIAKSYTDIERYFGLLDNQVEIKDPKNPIVPKNISGEIEFKNVTFHYEKKDKFPALRNINLKIRQGQSIALVGRSGAGKTTMVKLLLRFLDVSGGSITIDDIDIRNMNKSDLRSFIGVVPQEPVLFNNTIGYNIAYGNTKISKKEIVAAAKMANIHDFIDNLPKKYETQVGERGIKLSGGQKQRIAIARMIISNPDIIVFDEATSQLDSESEKLIQDAFWKASEGKTTIIIAHRLSTIRKADKIAVMEKGRIVEIGSHKELLHKRGGLYGYFWSLQSRSS